MTIAAYSPALRKRESACNADGTSTRSLPIGPARRSFVAFEGSMIAWCSLARHAVAICSTIRPDVDASQLGMYIARLSPGGGGPGSAGVCDLERRDNGGELTDSHVSRHTQTRSCQVSSYFAASAGSLGRG
eukprot:CAMPEP_0185029944 /NCGR_PEP_ID=MMETSP1103-20130426/16596_1 /TAXON_ID=36769 /ORGANISM="Paraphysomonas bandaiensis, Strain Caron Lab Isolate" /LENGTH=130 /DNA_ID=CAMNT_0027564875 /DNA_START=208 /DNA_END=600 /DNA_ORIENTATION=-